MLVLRHFFLEGTCYLFFFFPFIWSDLNFQAPLLKPVTVWNHLEPLTLRGHNTGGLRTQCGKVCVSNKLRDDSETASLWARFD